MIRNRVYFIQVGLDGPIKIGISCDPAARLKQLQKMNPTRLYLLGSFPGERGREAELQEHFAEYWIRSEWFHPVPTLVKFIEGFSYGNLDGPEPEASKLEWKLEALEQGLASMRAKIKEMDKQAIQLETIRTQVINLLPLL